MLNYSNTPGSLSEITVRALAPKNIPNDELLARGMGFQQENGRVGKKIISGKIQLGDAPEETFFIRYKKNKVSDRWEPSETGEMISDAFSYLQKLNNQGYGIYLIPNPGGNTDDEITECHYLFCEWDNETKDQQWLSLRELEARFGQKASTVVETHKSLHVYFKLDAPIAPDEWRCYQQRLIQSAKSDPAIQNPARLMRLPGFAHQRWDSESQTLKQFPVTVKQQTDSVFQLSDLNKLLPAWNPDMWGSTTTDQIEIDPADDPWDIRNFAHYLDGYLENGRQGWITCKCPVHDGVSDDSLHINQATGAVKCQAECNPSDIKKISIELAITRGWRKPRYSKKQQNKIKNTMENKKNQELTIENLIEDVQDLVSRDLSNGELAKEKDRLAKKYGRSIRDIHAWYTEYQEDAERKLEAPYVKAEIDDLIRTSSDNLSLNEFFPPKLGTPLTELSQVLNVKQAIVALAILTTVSALHVVGTRLKLGVGFSVSPNLYSAIVAESGQLKSPIINFLSKEPLTVLQLQALEEFRAAQKEYEEKIDEYNSYKSSQKAERDDKFPEGKPVEPHQKIYFFDEATGEAIIRQFEKHPDQGVLSLQDELAGLKKSANQYRNGKGKDEEDLLKFYDGAGATVLRVTGVKANVSQTLLSILGGIQPDVLATFMGACNDTNGHWARYIFAFQPNARTKVLWDQEEDLSQILTELYKKIDSFPKKAYGLDNNARAVFEAAYDELDKLRMSDPMQGMRYVWSKSKGRIGKLAINLHVINSALEGKEPSDFIPVERFREAVRLTWFFANQIKAYYASVAKANEDSLSYVLNRVIKISETKLSNRGNGWVSAREVISGMSSKQKPKANQARQWFRDLVSLGFGSTRNYGLSLEYNFLTNVKGSNPPPGSSPPPPSKPPKGNNNGFGGGGSNGNGNKPPTNPPTPPVSPAQVAVAMPASKNYNNSLVSAIATSVSSKNKEKDQSADNCRLSAESYQQPATERVSAVNPLPESTPVVTNSNAATERVSAYSAELLTDFSDRAQNFEEVENKLQKDLATRQKTFKQLVRIGLNEPEGCSSNNLKEIGKNSGMFQKFISSSALSPETPSMTVIEFVTTGEPVTEPEPEVLNAETLTVTGCKYDFPQSLQSSANCQHEEPTEGCFYFLEPSNTEERATAEPIYIDAAIDTDICYTEQPVCSSENHEYSLVKGVGTFSESKVAHNFSDLVTEVKVYSPLEALKRDGMTIKVDYDKIDLAYEPDGDIPDWQPHTKLPDYESICKIYLDIETTGLDPDVDRIIMVGLLDDQGEQRIICNRDEKLLLEETIQALDKLAPQHVYGHNLFAFDLPFLIRRCRINGITKHPWSRDDKREKRIGDSSVNGEPIMFHPIYWVACGSRKVDVLDTYQQCAIADKSQAIFNGYGLKDAAITLGLRKERRLELSHAEILANWEANTPEGLATIRKYLKYDLEDTKLLADRLFPGVYYQGEIVPGMSFQELGYMSGAFKWEKIFEGLYPENGNPRYSGIPVADEKFKYPGGKVSVNPGLYRNVAKLDVNSLYPSLMIKYHLSGREDKKLLGAAVMRYMLKRRLELKDEARTTGSELAKHQQHALKILLNSGYGFLGVGGYPYNDMDHAALICAYGSQVLATMQRELEALGATIIECDTDGIIFRGVDATTAKAQINEVLPDGITVGVDFQHTDVYVSGMKNYILFEADGSTKAVGEFRKRQNYKLKRQFVETYLKLHLEDGEQEADDYWQRTRQQLLSGEFDLDLLTERKKISKSDVKLQAAGLGKPGDVVYIWYKEKPKYHKTSGKQLKSDVVPTNTGSYYPTKYVTDIDDLHTTMLETISKGR